MTGGGSPRIREGLRVLAATVKKNTRITEEEEVKNQLTDHIHRNKMAFSKKKCFLPFISLFK